MSVTEDQHGSALNFPEIRVPAGVTLAALIGGLALGVVLRGSPAIFVPLLAVVTPIGDLWLKALEMTILPLVVALLVSGIDETMAAARAGAMAKRTLGLFASLIVGGAVMSALVTPAILALSPVPTGAAAALSQAGSAPPVAALPGFGAFLSSLIPANVVAAAAGDAILPTIVFFALFAVALGQVAPGPRRQIRLLFDGLAAAMIVMIGWVLWLAPIGVFALSLELAAKTGGSAFGVLAHYILVVSAVGGVVLLLAYILAVTVARLPLIAFLKAMLPVNAVALSTQSSLASLPAMLAACGKLGIRTTSAEFVLPLAVALLRATGPAMNLAVAIYVAHLSGVALTPTSLVAGVAVASLTTLGAPSISGVLSYVSSIAPIALAMGVPVAPLALLVAVEMLPDLMRTIGNVAADMAATAMVDRWSRETAA